MSQTPRRGSAGSGPGAIAPDGSPVDMYARHTAGTEPCIIAAALPEGASVLELGSGAGRLTRPLTTRGFRVTAVDESEQMLARVHGTRTVRARIETLDLGESFDAVLFASHLVNTGDARLRAAMLASCRRHTAPGGQILIQRSVVDWHTAGRRLPWERRDSGLTVRVTRADWLGEDRYDVEVSYRYPDAEWTQRLHTRQLDRPEFESALAAAGLELGSYLTPAGDWVAARPR